MWRSRNRLYVLLLFLCLLGYAWLLFNYLLVEHVSYLGFENHSPLFIDNSSVPVFCFFKNLTGYPCPSCGVTRSVAQLFRGNFLVALYMNPLGLLLFLIITTVPPWIIVDLLLKKASLWLFYKKAEIWFMQKKVFIPFAALIILNWIWNFVKGY